MQFLQPEEVSLDIEEIRIQSATSSLQRWRVVIHVNDGKEPSLRKERDISDPLKSISDHSKLRTYLNHTLDTSTSLSHNHEKIEEKLRSYPSNLSKFLDLDAYSSHLNGKKVNVWIHGIQLSPEISCEKSIHSLHWELLEDLSLWVSPEDAKSAKPASVTVRRCVKDVHVPNRQNEVTQTVQVGKSEFFNVLLVVARKKLHEDEPDYFNPTCALRAILEAQTELECRRAPNRIQLEVVRPGTYDELKIHLQQSHEKFRKKFQIVHFDVHGDIDPEIGAHLIFNQYANNGHHLVEHKVAASLIAELLCDYGIRYAVLSSCKTAVADAGVQANLSWSFLQKGVASVLAFSYAIPDSMSKIFFPCFYHELFVNHREFADAAAIARRKLCKNPDRWSYVQREHIKLQDWFTPKVYSNGKPWYFGKKPDLGFAIQNWMGTLEPQLILFIILLILTFVFEPLGWRSLVYYLAQFACVILLAELLRRCIIKWQSTKRLEMIDRDRKNILRVEGDLRRSHQILLHTVNDGGDTAHRLLDTLSYVWCRTHLVQHRVMIKAEWFLQPFPWDNSIGWDWTRLPRSIGYILQLWAQGFSPGLEQLSRRDGEEAKTVVVVTNVRALFPGESQEQSYHQNAQIRFRGWLERYFEFGGEDEGQTLSPLPFYLILTWKGWGGTSRPWFWPESLEGIKALERIIVTDYINPENFQHNLERPLTARSKL